MVRIATCLRSETQLDQGFCQTLKTTNQALFGSKALTLIYETPLDMEKEIKKGQEFDLFALEATEHLPPTTLPMWIRRIRGEYGRVSPIFVFADAQKSHNGTWLAKTLALRNEFFAEVKAMAAQTEMRVGLSIYTDHISNGLPGYQQYVTDQLQ